VEEVALLSPIVIVLKKNDKLEICVDFCKFNVAIKMDIHFLLFTNEVFKIVEKVFLMIFYDIIKYQ
jgi:hypothetical protein